MLIADLNWIKNVSSMPVSIELLFNQLHDSFLFGLDASLLFPETIQLSLSFRNFSSVCVQITNSRVWIFVPDIQNGNCDISS
jgi:hypothetical protein